MLTKTGALQAVIAKLARRFSGQHRNFIPLLSLVFALICTTQAVNMFIAFAPVMVMLSLALGLDSICGGGDYHSGRRHRIFHRHAECEHHGDQPEDRGSAAVLGDRLPVRLFRRVLRGDQSVLIRYANKIRKNPELSPMQ